ncbi:MAG: hypothetical protein IH914_10315, partial [candidate division Zixibacteria bacterium]|nr:hypothetical protein [candidate division Zixibacteria bacterium]
MKTTYIIASLLSFLPCLTVSAQIAPLGDPGADLYYLWNQRVKAASSNDLDFQLAPYIVVRDSTSPYALSDRLFPYWSNSEKSLRWFVSPAESFQSQQNRRSAALERLRGGVTVSLSDKIYAQSFFILDERLATDPLYTGKVWRGLAGDVETATISDAGEKLTALFGRYRSSSRIDHRNGCRRRVRFSCAANRPLQRGPPDLSRRPGNPAREAPGPVNTSGASKRRQIQAGS